MFKHLDMWRDGLTSKNQASDADIRYAAADHADSVFIQGVVDITPSLTWPDAHRCPVIADSDFFEA